MSTAILDPAPTLRDNGGNNPTHYTCCDDNVAMCGLDVTGFRFVPDDDPAPDCKYCVYAMDEGLPCPVAGCTEGGAS